MVVRLRFDGSSLGPFKHITSTYMKKEKYNRARWIEKQNTSKKSFFTNLIAASKIKKRRITEISKLKK